ncbi:MAG: M14 family zinc carboxypeptidase [Eubacteriales bacterium]|nr:M14 family zinc carboxypeptidase [Eubacteriales bacterium]
MIVSEALTYEKLYFSLWETAQRYGKFSQFRVIGKSHDDRMIPMLEIGNGQAAVFCLAGLNGTDRQMPEFLVQMALEYCQAYECHWLLDDFYDVHELLDKVRICMIPVLNPDGFDACGRGYTAVRNPIYRQMLRMQNTPCEEFYYNARGMDIRKNFPTAYYTRKRINQEPASENETKALIRIFQEYKSRGLLSFCQSEKKIVYYRQSQGFAFNQRSYRLARHLQKRSCYRLEKCQAADSAQGRGRIRSTGTPEQFYAETVKQPSLMIETPAVFGDTPELEQRCKKDYQEIHLLPLEYIYSLDN